MLGSSKQKLSIKKRSLLTQALGIYLRSFKYWFTSQKFKAQETIIKDFLEKLDWAPQNSAVIYIRECFAYFFFSSRSLIISRSTFSFLIHFEFIFVYGIRECCFCCCFLVSKSCQTLLWSAEVLFPWNFPGKNTGCHFLLQGIFLT